MSELEIFSPAPWSRDGNNRITDASGDLIVETDSGFYPPRDADARLIAEAPNLLKSTIELYELAKKYVSFPPKFVALNNDVAMKLSSAKVAVDKAFGRVDDKKLESMIKKTEFKVSSRTPEYGWTVDYIGTDIEQATKEWNACRKIYGKVNVTFEYKDEGRDWEPFVVN